MSWFDTARAKVPMEKKPQIDKWLNMENNSITYPDNLGGKNDAWDPGHIWALSFRSRHSKHKQLSLPPHEPTSRSLISNGKQETLWACSCCVWLMTTQELLFYLPEHNGVCLCMREREVYDTVYSKTVTLKNDIMPQLQMFLLLQSFSGCYFLPQSEQGMTEQEKY